MALISQDQSGGLTQIQGLTRPQILKRVLRETGYGQAGTTTAAGSTTTLVDATNLLSTQFNDRLWVGAFIYFTSGTLDGVVTTVTAYAPSTGTLTFPTQSGSPGSSATYQLFRTPFSPKVVIDALDTLLTQEWYAPCLTFLSEAADYDMEQTGTTAWSATNSTIAKTTWSLANHEGIYGNQALSVTNTSANGYVTPAAPFRVSPGNTYYAGVFFAPTDPTATHTGTFVIYDQTNSVVIETITTTSKTPVFLGTSFETPATCNLLQIRMGASQNSVVSVFDELVVFDALGYDIALPWWVRSADSVKNLYTWRPHQSLQSSNSKVYPAGWSGQKLADYDFLVTQTGSGQWRANSQSTPINGPIYLEGTRNETAFASNTEAKRVSENWVVARLGATLFDMMLSYSQQVDAGPLIERKNTWQGMANKEMEVAAYKPQRQHRSRTQWISL